MTAVFAFLAILLATLTGHAPDSPAPAQHLEQAEVSPSAVPLHDDRAQGGAQRQVGQQGDQHAATVPAPQSYFPQTWTPVLTPPPMPELPPVSDGFTDGPMCPDPVDCAPSS